VLAATVGAINKDIVYRHSVVAPVSNPGLAVRTPGAKKEYADAVSLSGCNGKDHIFRLEFLGFLPAWPIFFGAAERVPKLLLSAASKPRSHG